MASFLTWLLDAILESIINGYKLVLCLLIYINTKQRGDRDEDER